MPWSPKAFQQKHNKKLSLPQAKKAAAQATAIMKSGAPEGVAIATANKFAARPLKTIMPASFKPAKAKAKR